jgi:Rod binding domain-containing protein
MNIPALKPQVDPSEIAPERLANNPRLTERQKIGEASRQFESILLKQILESSQKTVIKSKFSDDSTASSIYHDMVTTRLADSISKSGSFGLARTFEQQLNRTPAHGGKAGVETGSPALPATAHEAAAQTEFQHRKTISAELHAAGQTLKPLHERTLTKPH